MSTPAVAPVTGIVGQFFTGVGELFRGLRLYVRNPGLVLLGIIPALVTGALFMAGFVALAFVVSDVATTLTPFAEDWAEWARGAIRVSATLAVLGLAGLLGVLAFTAVTLAIGDPFYERISERVEEWHGGVAHPVEVSWARSLRRSLADSVRLVAVSLLVGVPLFVGGFLPVVGQTVVPVLGAVVGGWVLALELAGSAFYRRGLGLRERRRALRAVRPITLGFGVAVFVLFLLPFGAVLFTPAAIAGATLLARRSLGEPVERT